MMYGSKYQNIILINSNACLDTMISRLIETFKRIGSSAFSVKSAWISLDYWVYWSMRILSPNTDDATIGSSTSEASTRLSSVSGERKPTDMMKQP